MSAIYKQADEPSAQEEVWTKLWAIFERVKPDFHIDLHSYGAQRKTRYLQVPMNLSQCDAFSGLSTAMPFIYVDR